MKYPKVPVWRIIIFL